MTKSNKKSNQSTQFSQELLNDLMKDYNPSKPEDLIGRNGLLNNLKKALIEKALGTEMNIHLGYEKNCQSGNNNYRNGYSSKTVITDDDRITIDTPRDRDSSFEPQIIQKGQRRFSGFDDKVISMYARGMTLSEIQGHVWTPI